MRNGRTHWGSLPFLKEASAVADAFGFSHVADQEAVLPSHQLQHSMVSERPYPWSVENG